MAKRRKKTSYDYDPSNNRTVPNTEGDFGGAYINPDSYNEQASNEGGSEPKGPDIGQGWTVLGTVDVPGHRTDPGADPAGEGSYSYEQHPYYKVPEYNDDD